MEKMQDKYRAVILGTALGDSLGMPVEGWKHGQISKYTLMAFGKKGINEPIEPEDLYRVMRDSEKNLPKNDEFGRLRYWSANKKRGMWTDDTILTLAIAESIATTKELNLKDIAKAHVDAFTARLLPDGTVEGGFGRTTSDAINELINGSLPSNSAVGRGNGNGPAMKMAPVGMFMEASKAYNRGLNFAENVGLMTHLDSRSVLSGVIQAQAIYSLLLDIPKSEFLSECILTASKFEQPLTGDELKADDGFYSDRFIWMNDLAVLSDDEAYQALGGGFEVYTSVPHAYFMFLRYWDDPLTGLLKLVNYGGDSDTTGAIYGALAGAKHGLSFMPKEWLEVIDQKERLVKAADGIYALKNK